MSIDTSHQPAPFPAIPRRQPAARGLRPRRHRGRAAEAAARPDAVGPPRPRPADQEPEGSHQRLRLRAGDAQERAAGAFRLHGVGHRRRGHAARQPRGLPEVPAAPAPPGRRQQGRHEHRHPRREYRPRSSSRRSAARSLFHDEGELAVASGREGRQPSADPLDRDHQPPRGRHRGARRADLVPALRHQQVRGREGVRDARRAGGLPGGRRDGGPQRRPQPGNVVPAAAHRHARLQRVPRPQQPAGEPQAQADVPGRRHFRAYATRSPPP